MEIQEASEEVIEGENRFPGPKHLIWKQTSKRTKKQRCMHMNALTSASSMIHAPRACISAHFGPRA